MCIRDSYILEAEYEVIEEEPLAENAAAESEPEAEVDQSEVCLLYTSRCV